MIGLALEGGGARGAYHIGVVKAYLENGYEFDGFVGTSIGAINAAILAQGSIDKATEIWQNITMAQLFDAQERHILEIIEHGAFKLDKLSLEKARKAAAKIIRGGGVSTKKIEALLKKYIDEDKIRKSGKDFGLVTVAVDKFKPYELMLKDIADGELVDYIMASASIPGFRPKVIEKHKYIDGAFYNNCPVNLLVKNGYERVIAVRTFSLGILREIDGDAQVTIVTHSRSLGNIMLFSQKACTENIELGYNDGINSIRNPHNAHTHWHHAKLSKKTVGK